MDSNLLPLVLSFFARIFNYLPSSSMPFTVSEFSYYNVYRSRKYFTNVNGMIPYASGKEIYELSKFHVYWLDRDPLTNENAWYAVTIVTRKGKERKNVNPTKVLSLCYLFWDFSPNLL